MTLVGLYGGSFDPLHNGHLNLAIELMEHHQLDEVWFIPVAISPHKEDAPPISAEHRLEMVKLAIEDIPQFKVLDLEIRRKGPSYTVDTVEELMAQPGAPEMRFILGEDSLREFHRWHRVHDLIEKIPLLIGSRFSDELMPHIKGDEAVLEAIQRGRTDTSLMEISATALRDRLKERLYCGHLVPHKVLDYIYLNQLYC